MNSMRSLGKEMIETLRQEIRQIRRNLSKVIERYKKDVEKLENV